jgi:hypothetical protein
MAMINHADRRAETKGLKIIGAGFGRTGTSSLTMALEELGFRPCYHMREVMRHPEHLPQWEAASRGEAVDWHTFFADYQAAVDWPSSSFYEELMQVYPEAKIVLTVRDPEQWYESTINTIYPLFFRIMSRLPLHFYLLLRMTDLAIPGKAIRRIFFRKGRIVDAVAGSGTIIDQFKNYNIDALEQHFEEKVKHFPLRLYIPLKMEKIAILGKAMKRRFYRRGGMLDVLVWNGIFKGQFEDKAYAIRVFEQHIEEVKKRVSAEKLLVYDVKDGWEPLCTFLGVNVPEGKSFPHLNGRARPGGRSARAPERAGASRGLPLTGTKAERGI